MWYFILLGLIAVVGFLTFTIFSVKDGDSELFFFGNFVLFVVLGLFGLVTFYPVIKSTTGFWPNYSIGERVGYVTKISLQKGIIWKTTEGQMQLGSGQLAALQEPFSFSVVDKDLILKIQESAEKGLRVKLGYTQWLLMPFKFGESDYIITSLTKLD